MKTEIAQKIYRIYEEEKGESIVGVIPSGVLSAIVGYDKDGPKSVYFVPRDTKDNLRINPERTREEVVSVVNALEKALER